MLEYQKHQLNVAMKELGKNAYNIKDNEKKDIGGETSNRDNRSINEDYSIELESKLMNIRSMKPNEWL